MPLLPCAGGADQSVVEIDPLGCHAEFGQALALGSEILLVGGATRVADDRGAYGR